MDNQRVIEFLKKILRLAQGIAFFTPNPIDNIVVGILQMLMNNKTTLNLLLFILERIRLAKENRMVGDEEVDGIVFSAIKDFKE